MDILEHTNEQSPTFMRDVYHALVGENVIVYLNGCHTALGGKLEHFNGAVVHLTSGTGINNTYIPVDKIIAICSEK